MKKVFFGLVVSGFNFFPVSTNQHKAASYTCLKGGGWRCGKDLYEDNKK